ncbi:AAC(3) family N-acetyltransferase [Lunatibacter salilacus]|uniref:AAC(3) family N-acetyltransferase n=1 Tax=Lunatibacter salilacus TaxID=2483804 RepID=UPI00131E7699|nr:AAC(3) family N-acetyltransferase [Lunatibacter salilacus]
MVKDVIKSELIGLGLKKGDKVLVHASLKSLGKLPDAAKTVTDAFLELLGNEGTLLMPALSYSSVTKENPFFDWGHTPSCVGGLSEYFRTRTGAIRSIHPTHSVCALGKEAGHFTESHFNERTPVGSNSPFFKLKQAKGKVLFLGCGLKPNTSMHGVEELVTPPYLFGEEREYTLRISSDETIKKTYVPHGFAGYIQRYDRLLDVLDPEDYGIGKVLEAEVYLLDCQVFWKKAAEVLRQDPFYFVDRA